MRRNILILCLLFWTVVAVQAQKHTVYADDFSSEVKVLNRVLTAIRVAVIDGIRHTNRVNIVDALVANPDLSITPLEDARRFGAEYLLTGRLLNREATDDGSEHRRYHSRENSFKEKFKLHLDLVRTSDGTTIGTRDYEENGSASGKDASQFMALERALLNIPYEMRQFVESYFKVYGAILRTAASNGRKAKAVYINLGYDDPIKEGLRFDVVEDGMIEGNYIEKKIGEVRIDQVMGPKISLCKVNKGGEDILNALNNGTSLRLVSRQAKLFDE